MSYTGTTPKFDSVEGDNIKIDGNTISSTDTNGDINLTPNGTGKVRVATQAPGNNSTAVATTEYVDDAVAAVPTFDPANYYDKTEVDNKDAATLSAANTYTDDEIAAIPAGEVATAANVGTGLGVYKEKTLSEFKFRTLIAGANIQLTSNANDITISAAAPAGAPVVETFPILNAQTNTLIKTYNGKSKALDITYSINRGITDVFTRPVNLSTKTTDYFNRQTIFGSTVQADGKIIVFGAFTNFLSQTGKSRVIRFNSDGTEDTAFSANAVVSGTTAKFSSFPRAAVVQPDGKILIGGNFTTYAGQTGKSYLIRLNADGTEDTAFSANAVVNGTTNRFNSAVQDILIQPDGKILIGGAFTNYNAQTGKNYLIRLNADGTEDTTFSTNAIVTGTTAKFNGTVRSLSLQSDGKILIGGDFSNYPTPATPTGKNYAVRLNSDGTEDTVFNGNIINKLTSGMGVPVYDIAVRPDGKVVIGGELENYGGQIGKSYLIVLNSDGTEDTAFSANAIVSGTTPKFNGAINAVVCQADNKIVVAGSFTSYAGTTGENYLIRLNADGTEDTSFTTNAVYDGSNSLFSTSVQSLYLHSDGKIYIGGAFLSSVPSINSFRILNTDGTAYNPPFLVINKFNGTSVGNVVKTIVTQTDGKVLIGGGFTHYSGMLGKNYLIRLNVDGTEDTAFSANAVVSGTTSKFPFSILNNIFAIVLQADGKILVGGNFTNYNDQTGKNHLIRFNSDGTEDTAFSANAVVSGTTPKFNNGSVSAIAVQSDGKILVGGSFLNYAGQTGKSYLIRLNADGTEDTAFSANAVVSGTTARINGEVLTIALQSNAQILLGGAFTNYFATGKSRLMRLNSDGTEDTTFSTNAVVSGTTARISGTVWSIAVQPNQLIVLGGDFNNYFATGKNKLMRLNTNGTEDTTFSAAAVVNTTTARFSAAVLSVAVQPDNKVIVGGNFVDWSAGTGKNRLMRFNTNGTEDTVFTNSFVLSGTTPKFNAAVGFVRVENTRVYALGGFLNYPFAYSTNSFLVGIEMEPRIQIGKLLGIPTNVNEFSFSTPTTLGSEANFLTGVTLTFGTDGTVKYTSGTLDASSARADVITIETKEY